MESIHGRRLIYSGSQGRRQMSANVHAMRLPWRGVGSTASVVKSTPSAYSNLIIMQPQRPLNLGQRMRSCASARVLQRNVLPDNILGPEGTPAAGHIEGFSPSESHPSIRGKVPLRRHFTATQDALCRCFCHHCAVILAEVYCDTPRPTQNWPSDQQVAARLVCLGIAWPGAARPLIL
jgi:hypothetical protein